MHCIDWPFPVSAAVASIQVSGASPIPPEVYCDSRNVNQEHIYTKKPANNILKQAWLDCQGLDSGSSMDSDAGMTGDRLKSSSDDTSSSEFGLNYGKSKRARVKPGLPKPKMYKQVPVDKKNSQASKKRKIQQREMALDNDSSDDDDGTKFISKLEKEIYSKPRNSLETEAMEEMLTTSTPTRPQQMSHTDLPSPIHSLTPLRTGSLFDGSFLNPLEEPKGLNLLEKADDNFNDSLIDFGILPFVSPDKLQGSPCHDDSLSNQNLSKIFSEYGLDTAQDIAEHFPNLNWSVVEQMVDSMDTS